MSGRGRVKESRNKKIAETYQDACPHCGGRHTMKSVGKLFNISPSRVYQLVKKFNQQVRSEGRQ